MRDAVHLLRTKPARRNVVPIKEDARTPVRETDFEAARLGHDLVLDNSNWHPRGLSPGRLLDELLQRIRQFAVLIGAALEQLSRYRFGHVANPTFREVKANDANRVVVLAFQQILDDSFKIGVFNVCLAPGGALVRAAYLKREFRRAATLVAAKRDPPAAKS